MEQSILLSVAGDAQAALPLGQWIRRGAPSCKVQPVGAGPSAGEKGADLTATLAITMLGTPAVVQLIDCIKAYLTTKPQVTVTLKRADGSQIEVGGNLQAAQASELVERLRGILDGAA